MTITPQGRRLSHRLLQPNSRLRLHILLQLQYRVLAPDSRLLGNPRSVPPP
jgi:hypothetical protein